MFGSSRKISKKTISEIINTMEISGSMANNQKALIKRQKYDSEFQSYYSQTQLMCYDVYLASQDADRKNCQYILYELLQRPQKSEAVKSLIQKELKKNQKQSKWKKFINQQATSDQQRGQLIPKKIIRINKKMSESNWKQLIIHRYVERVERFQQLLINIYNSDLGTLYKLQKQLQILLNELLKQVDFIELLKFDFRSLFEYFLDLLRLKIQQVPNIIPYYQLLFPSLHSIQSRLENILKYKGSTQEKRDKFSPDKGIYQNSFSNMVFNIYIEDVETKLNRNCIIFVPHPFEPSEKVPFQLIFQYFPQFFDVNNGWRNLIFLINEHISKGYPLRYQIVMNNYFLNNLPDIILPTQDCLGCSEFFYVNQNIYRPEIQKHMVALLGRAKQAGKKRNQILSQICAMLNGGGGVLLFDCRISYNNIIPQGQYLSHHEMEKIKKIVLNFIFANSAQNPNIYPKLEIDKNIVISWVPIAQYSFGSTKSKNSGENQIGKDQIEEQNEIGKDQTTEDQIGEDQIKYIRDLYVIRIVVKPTFGNIVYYWKKYQNYQSSQQIYQVRTASIFHQFKVKIQDENISQFLQLRRQDFSFEFQDLNPIELKTSKNNFFSFDHQCKHPNEPVYLFQEQTHENIITSHQGYKFSSIITVSQANHPMLKRNLKKYDIECQLRAALKNSGFQKAQQFSIIYHNVLYNELMAVMYENKDFISDSGHNFHAIPLTTYIKLIARNKENILPQYLFEQFAKRLSQYDINETLNVWRFIENEQIQEFYVETKRKQFLLFMFILLSEMKEECAFEDPKGLNDIAKQEKNKRFKLLYSSKGKFILP